MKQTISQRLLDAWGFQVEVPVPLPKKCVVPVVPHTSNWDFPLGLLVRAAIDTDIHFVGKDSLFKGPLGPIMRSLGGHPVDRSKRNNFVSSVVDLFNEVDELRLCLAPEGTRKRVDKLKTGFYWIARGAEVPLILCRFDWAKRLVSFSPPFYPTADAEADLAYINDYFAGIRGFHAKHSFRHGGLE
jgi:1-acyl-sn-glycerol-3-phosphate acyltransferase